MPLAEWSDKPTVHNQDDVLFPLKVRERYGVAIHIDGGKIRSRCINFFDRYAYLFFNLNDQDHSENDLNDQADNI